MNDFRVLKIIAEGPVTSFRYPHFVQGVHPTYEMPPPATIYGHIASAVGDQFPPETLRFAYHFSYQAKFVDYEHLHFPPASMNKDQRQVYKTIQSAFGSASAPPAINPFKRELLYAPRLTLYLDPTNWTGDNLEDAFYHPKYPVVLGRSQDLMTYTSIRWIKLKQADRAYFSGTLLSLEDGAIVGGQSYAVTMARFIKDDRIPQWGQYTLLPDNPRPPIYPDEAIQTGDKRLLWWIDEEEPHPQDNDIYRAVYWLRWID